MDYRLSANLAEFASHTLKSTVHRLHTDREVDVVVVLEDGQIYLRYGHLRSYWIRNGESLEDCGTRRFDKPRYLSLLFSKALVQCK